MSQLVSHLKDLIAHREILWFLALKDVKIRYKSSSLGFTWAMIAPLGQMLILSFVFTMVVRFEIRAYPVFLLIALLPWSFFQLSINFTTTSMIDHGPLIKKIYFPRDVIPLAQILSNLFDFTIALLILLPFLVIFRIGLSRWILLLPVALALQLMFTAGIALMLSSLTVMYRDIKYLKELSLMFWFYASPVFYPVSFVEDSLGATAAFLYQLNPMAGIIQIYRHIFYFQSMPSLWLIGYTAVVSLAILVLGFKVFRRYERSISDLV